MSLKPKSARVWVAVAAVFVLLAFVCGAAFWALQHQTRRVTSSGCIERGGSWDADRSVCSAAPRE